MAIATCMALVSCSQVARKVSDSGANQSPSDSRSDELAPDGSIIGVKFTGRVNIHQLSKLSSISTLRKLDLRDTKLGDAQLRFLRGLNLEWLDIAGTTIEHPGFHNLSTQSQLKYLDLGGTNVADEDLAALSTLEKLQELDVGGTHITEDGIRHLSAIQNLESIDVGFSNVQGAGLQSMAEMPGLKRIEPCYDQLDDSGLKAISELHELEQIDIWVVDSNSAADEQRERIRSVLPSVKIETYFISRHSFD